MKFNIFMTELYINKRIFIYWTIHFRLLILMLASIYFINALKVFYKYKYFFFRITNITYFYFKGYLKDKTCILITHQIQYLTSVDQIVLMDNVMHIIFYFLFIILSYTNIILIVIDVVSGENIE